MDRKLLTFFLILVTLGKLYPQSVTPTSEDSAKKEETSQTSSKKEDSPPDEDFFKMEENKNPYFSNVLLFVL